MSPESLLRVSEVYYHSNCPDGIGSAVICSAAFQAAGKTPPKFVSAQYGVQKYEDMEAKSGQLFVDITPPRSRWEDWKGLNPVVLDHHSTSKHIVEGLDGVFGDNLSHSGAMLAFENVLMPLAGNLSSMDVDAWQRFAHLCMVRDTWKSNHEDWYEASSLAHALLTFDRDKFIENPSKAIRQRDHLMETGSAIYDRIIRQAKSVMESSMTDTIATTSRELKLACFNLDKAGMSDIAHEILDHGYDVTVGYFYLMRDDVLQCVVSLRSNTVNVGEVAASFGGGGHVAAAGFKVSDAEQMSPRAIFEMVRGRLR